MSNFIDKKYFEFDELNEDEDDFMLAMQIQMQLDNEEQKDESYEEDKFKIEKFQPFRDKSNDKEDLMDPHWELIDPSPDIRAMFQEFDKKYFWNKLGSCVVEWSKRMTICAGIFYLKEGGIIRLSEPLLKYRPRHDLVQTLLHEMIHAYLYITRNFKDRGEHGDEFKKHMVRINNAANTNITVYHSFHDEVNACRQHVWRCDGECRKMPPFYGYVKRSMNRAPGKNDTWWSSHQSKCNGKFIKISEPENYAKKSKANETSIIKKESNKKTSTQSSKTLTNVKTIDSYFGDKTISSSFNVSNQIISKPKTVPSSQKATQKETSNKQSSSGMIIINGILMNKNKRKSDEDLINVLNSSEICSEASSSNSIYKYLKKSIKSESEDDKPKVEEKIKIKNEKINESDLIVLEDDDNDNSYTNDIFVINNEDLNSVKASSKSTVECPICFASFNDNLIESHVNSHFSN